MSRLMIALAACGALVTGSTGCFDTPEPSCAFLCGTNNACPDGYRCAGDGWCKRDDVPESFSCGIVPVDAALPDAGVDGAAPPDAGPDAAAPDAAAIDAAVPDAALIDAGVSDAAAIDAGAIDAMTPDASAADAMAPDATPTPDAGIDAMPPDAGPDAGPFVNSPPELSIPVSSPLPALAGDTIMFTVTASDPDEGVGQTVTLSAAHGGTEQDPFAAAAGASFNPDTGVFSMPAGVLGDFDVTFTASDDFDTPATDTFTLTINVFPANVVINEVRNQPGPQQAIELRNRSLSAVANLTGWHLCVGTDCFAIPAIASNFAFDSYMVIRWNQAGTDSATEVFTGTGLTDLDDEGTIVLYNAATPSPSAVMDGLVYDVAGGLHTLIDDLVSANQWPSNDPDADGIGGNPTGDQTYQYDGIGESAGDWSIAAGTLGAAN